MEDIGATILHALGIDPEQALRDATRTYRARILEKTGVRNDVELALYSQTL